MARQSCGTAGRTRAAAAAVALGGLVVLAGCGSAAPVAMSAPVVDPTTTAPQPPTALTAELGDATTTLRWTASETSDPTGYRLWVDTDEPVDLLGDTLTYELSGLDAGKHLVQLATVTADGVSAAATYSFAVPYAEAPPRPIATRGAAPVETPTAPVAGAIASSATPSAAAPAPAAPAPAPDQAASSTAPRRVITVELELDQVVVYDMTIGETSAGLCEKGGRDGYDDIGPGANVTVRGASGDITGTSTMTKSRFVELTTEAVYRGPAVPDDISIPPDQWEDHDFLRGTCVYSGDVDVPTDNFYTVEVNHRGETPVSESDLQANGGVVRTTLG